MFKKFLVVYALLFICIGSSADSLSDSPYYQQEAAGRDGIGKYYMGREISYVMGHLGSSWLERTTREQEERTDLLLENMKLRPTDIVIDLGAGTGYFSFPIARKVPDGAVIAVDIQPEMLSIIEQRKTRENIANIETLLATVSNPNIPESIADVVLLVDAYHEFSHPREVMEGVVKGLKPNGRVVLVEYRGEDSRVLIKRLHKMTQQQARKEMQAVGLKWLQTDTYLPQQHVMIFIKPPHTADY
ncbi:MAG: ubiquinone/menaquinone biosynthesis C-methylase UbiE [Oleispira sp.]|jgi:ubiquinone/menaquinone biosynthesis C-methylase UbiE